MRRALMTANPYPVLLENFETSIDSRWAQGHQGILIEYSSAALAGATGGLVRHGQTSWPNIATRYLSNPPGGRSPVRGEVLSFRVQGTTASSANYLYALLHATLTSGDTTNYRPQTGYYVSINQSTLAIGYFNGSTQTGTASNSHNLTFTRSDMEVRFYVNPSTHPTLPNKIEAKIVDADDGSTLFAGVSGTIPGGNDFTAGTVAVGSDNAYKASPTDYYVDNFRLLGSF